MKHRYYPDGTPRGFGHLFDKVGEWPRWSRLLFLGAHIAAIAASAVMLARIYK
jgi:hypothetical protein